MKCNHFTQARDNAVKGVEKCCPKGGDKSILLIIAMYSPKILSITSCTTIEMLLLRTKCNNAMSTESKA